jgi:Ca2+-binding RTX toxin-like protein
MGLSYYSISDLSLTEGDSGVLTLSRTGDITTHADVWLNSHDGNAVQHQDYAPITNQQLHFNPGVSQISTTFSTLEDSSIEGNESLELSLYAGSGGVQAKSIGRVTIIDDDFYKSIYTVDLVGLMEGETKTIKISRQGYTAGSETVNLSTKDDSSEYSAVAGIDYTPFSIDITFNAGETAKYATVSAINDGIFEEYTESFQLSLRSKRDNSELAIASAVISPDDRSAPSAIATSKVLTSNNPVTSTNSINPIATTNNINPVAANNGYNLINGTVSSNSNNQSNSNNTYNITNNYTSNVNSGNSYTANSNSGNTLTNTNSGNTTTTTNTNSNNTTTTTNTNWSLMRVDNSVKTGDIVSQFFKDSPITSVQTRDITETKILDVVTNTWSDKVQVNRVSRATDKGDTLEALAPDSAVTTPTGSVLAGGKGADVIMGKSGWDNLEGGEGDDLIHGGNGRDIITGGSGRDELWGDFGWNTFKSEKDGFSDLIVVKSDQWVVNWLYGKAGNNANGEKCDIIEGLDSSDKLKIVGANTKDLTFSQGVSAHGVKGIGVYAKGALEALYTGGDLTIAQLTQMTSGDASEGAFANTITKFGSW